MIIGNLISISGKVLGAPSPPPVITDYLLWSEPSNALLINNTTTDKLIWK